MKIETINDERLIIYYTCILDDILDYTQEDIKTFIKILVLRLRKKYHLNLKGYYHLDVYINKIMILDFVKIDDYDDEIDLNIILHLNTLILVRFSDYFLIEGQKYFYKGHYYININDIDIDKYSEFISYVYEKEAKEIKNLGYKV